MIEGSEFVDTGYLSRYVDGVDPVILTSARKHGIRDNDMLHAYRNPVRVFDLDDLVMQIGADEAGRLLEIGVGREKAWSSSSTPWQPDHDS